MSSAFLTNEKKYLPIYVECSGIEDQKPCDRTKDCRCMPQLTLCIEGTGVFIDENNNKHELVRGDIFGFRKDVPHAYYPISEKWGLIWITFDGKMVDDIMDYAGFGDTYVIKPDSIRVYEKLYTYMKWIHLTYWQDSESKHNQLSPVLYGIILRLGSVKGALPQQYEYSSEKEEKLAPVMREIFVNFNKNLSSSSLADLIGVSSRSLNKLFNEVYHISPMMYLRNVRLFYAQHELIRNKGISISEVANDAGFYDESYFCKLFAEKFGESPKQFQKTHEMDELVGIGSILEL